MNIFEWAFIGFIVLSIFYHVWRGGARNPESTGSLGNKVTALQSKLITIDGRVDSVEKKIDRIETEGASTADIVNLEKLISERLESQRAISEQTSRNVQRIYDIMLEKGLGAK